MEQSKLRLVSLGIVAANKALSSKDIEVVPIELVPYLDNEVSQETEILSGEGEDGLGNKYNIKITAGVSILASWIPYGSNRTTAPDVRRGERVNIWQYADSDKYYWQEMGLDDNLRTRETVVYAYSNVPEDGTDRKLTFDDCYTFEWCTHTKHITMRTSDTDGEKFIYTFQINAADSNVTIQDNGGNFIQLDSENTVINLLNADATQMILTKTNIYVHAKDNIVYTCDNFELTADSSITFNTKAWEATATDSITFNTKAWEATATASIAINTATLDITSPASTISGTLAVGGAVSVGGGATITPGGAMTIKSVDAASISVGSITGGSGMFGSSDNKHSH